MRVAASEPKRVYALIEAEEGGLFRSDNGGKKWTRISASRGIRQRAWYYTTLTIDPANAEVVWFPQVSMLKTTDGGKSIRAVKGGGWDYHDVWIDPENTKRIIVGSDAGVSLSSDGGETWFRPSPADCPVLPPVGRHLHALPGDGQPAGFRDGFRPQQQPAQWRNPVFGLAPGRRR